MKPSVTYGILLLFIIATQSLFSSTTTSVAAADDDIVKDSKGKKVLDNVRYHIGAVTPAKGGRIKLTDTINNKKVCPLDVVQDMSEDEVGGQFMFTLIGTYSDKYLHTSGILGIDSGSPESDCDKWTFWTIPDPEALPPSNLITTGDPFEEDTTCFQVVDYPKPTNPEVPSYMLQHCPYFCGAGAQTCFNISIYEDNGVRRLSSTGATPFEFAFYKVKTAHDSV